MRNLKKILALVLALVMSFSLMATAGAESFQDVKDDNPYKTAIDVLTELKVVKGYGDGNFQPDGQLNRAEAAVLVYRIATGDVEDKYLDNYTFMQQSKFEDLDGYNWAKGYINYCQNAGIVVGTDATHFNPGGKVTGYQLLVMLLRTLGYGKAGEFADPKGWELQTAAIAEREGILKNVTTGDLGAPAPRAMVAELLFRGLLTETVTYSALTSGGYTKGETLGMREFKLEEIEGVVVANEFADLYSNQVMAEGKTNLELAKDDIRTLDISTKITDVGMRQHAYIAGSKVLTMDDTGLNTVKEYGEGVDITSTAKFQKAAEMSQVVSGPDATQFYKNFGRTGNVTCDQRLEFVVTFTYKAGETYKPDGTLYGNLNQIIADFQDDYVGGLNLTSAEVGMTKVNDALNTATFSKIIRAGADISDLDLAVIHGIFAAADNNNSSNTLFEGVEGDVYVGTFSTNAANNEERDLSNQISYNKFLVDYLNPETYDVNWNTSSNGDWVKFIDNDNDGSCEYAFLTEYELQEAIGSNKNAAGDTILQYNDFDDAGKRFYPVVYMNGDERVERSIEVGDIVLVATIDSQILVSEAASVTTSANSYSYKDNSISAADGETYIQSYIGNLTGMQDLLASMAPKTEYEMFLDKFGFVRAYRQPGGIQYALVTELYYNNNQNGNIQQNWPMTAELTMPDENGNPVTKEYPVAAGGASQLVAAQPWALVNSLASTGNYYNWLQPAIAHLGVTRTGYAPTKGAATWDNTYSTYWPANRQMIKNITGWPATLQEFNYGKQTYGNTTLNADGSINWNQAQNAGTASFTNIAVVNGDETVTLSGAAQVRLNTNGQPALAPGNAGAYAVDYIQLSTDRPAAGASSYKVDSTDATYAQSYNYYVNADKETEIYVVYNGGVKYFEGYGKMVELKESLVGKIHAAYAVARNTDTGTGAVGGPGKNYWVADVIVYEVEKWNDASANSISLIYYTASQQTQTANSVTLETLNSKTNPAKVSLVPSDLSWNNVNNWWGNWGYDNNTKFGFNDYGFYQLYNETAPAEGETVMSARAIKKIVEDYNKSGIYAGYVAREVDLATAGYIPVNLTGDREANGTLKIEGQIIISDKNIYSITDEDWTNTTTYWNYFEADNIWYNNTEYSQVKANDRIMWVGAAPKATVPTSASFIVDVGSNTNGLNDKIDNTILWKSTPDWVKNQWSAVYTDQNKDPVPADKPTVTFYGTEATLSGTAYTVSGGVSYSAAAGTTNGIAVTDGTIVIANATIGTSTISSDKLSASTTRNTSAVTYTGTILGKDDNYYTYSFTQNAAKTGAVLTPNKGPVKDSADGSPNTGENLALPNTVTDAEPVAGWLKRAELASGSENAKVTWTVTMKDGTVITAEGIGNAMTFDPANSPYWTDTNLNVKSVDATVTSEDGKKTNIYTTKATADMPKVTVTVDNGIKVFNGNNWGVTWAEAQIANNATVGGVTVGVTATSGGQITKVDIPYGSTMTGQGLVFVAQGEGTWNVTGGVGGEWQGYLDSGFTILYAKPTAAGSVTFTPKPAAEQTKLQVVAGTGIQTGAGAAAAGAARVTTDGPGNFHNFLPHVFEKGQAIHVYVEPVSTERIVKVTWTNGTQSGVLTQQAKNVADPTLKYWYDIDGAVTATMDASKPVTINVELATINRTLNVTDTTGGGLSVTYMPQGSSTYTTVDVGPNATLGSTNISTLGEVTIVSKDTSANIKVTLTNNGAREASKTNSYTWVSGSITDNLVLTVAPNT